MCLCVHLDGNHNQNYFPYEEMMKMLGVRSKEALVREVDMRRMTPPRRIKATGIKTQVIHDFFCCINII